MPGADLTLEALRAWGADFATRLTRPACVTVSGDLGAGKTTLVQSIAAALGVTEPVTSPTYALVHEYTGARAPVTHVDLYRLRGEDQLPQIGWEDVTRGPGVLLVEWPERAPAAMPAHAIALTLAHVPSHPEVRRLTWPEGA